MANQSKVADDDCWLTWETIGQEETAILNFSDSFLERLGWKYEDELEFVEQEDGSWLVRKVSTN